MQKQVFKLLLATAFMGGCADTREMLVPGFVSIDLNPVSYHGTVAMPATDTIFARVSNNLNVPAKNVRVTFTPSDTTARIRPLSSRTDAQGGIRAIWVFGKVAGYQEAEIQVEQIQKTRFVAQVEPGPVATLTLTPPAAPLLAGDVYNIPNSAVDRFGNEVMLRSWHIGHPAARRVEWSVDPNLGAVDSLGRARPRRAGTLMVTASIEGTSATVAISAIPAAAVSLGYDHKCVLLTDGQVACINRIDTASSYVGGATRFTTIASGYATDCALTAAHEFWCWGQLSTDTRTNEPTKMPGNYDFVQLISGTGAVCGLTASGELYCGLGTLEREPFHLFAGTALQSVNVGYHVCAIAIDREVYCWDHDSKAVVHVATDLRFTTLAAGERHKCGMVDDGSAYCWGYELSGELGDGPGSPELCGIERCSTRPVPVYGSHRYKKIVAGDQSVCALDVDAQVWCWGGGMEVPSLLPGGDRYTNLWNYGGAYCGVTDGGAAYCWGRTMTPSSPGSPKGKP